MAQFNAVEEYVETVDIAPIVTETYTDKEVVAEILKAHAVKDRIACGRLRKIAKELGLPSNKLGSIAKEYNIKIVACELGCF